MLDKLAVSENPASEAQKERRKRERAELLASAEMAPMPERQSSNLSNVSTQPERAKSSGISRTQQQTLDKIAKLAPDHLPRIAAKEITINRAAVELGIVKGRAGRNRQSPSRPGVA